MRSGSRTAGHEHEMSLLAKVLWAVVAGFLLAPLVIAAAGWPVPAPAILHGVL